MRSLFLKWRARVRTLGKHQRRRININQWVLQFISVKQLYFSIQQLRQINAMLRQIVYLCYSTLFFFFLGCNEHTAVLFRSLDFTIDELLRSRERTKTKWEENVVDRTIRSVRRNHQSDGELCYFSRHKYLRNSFILSCERCL